MQGAALSKRKFKRAVPARMQFRTSLKGHQQNKRWRNVNSRMKRLQVEIEERNEEQKKIKEEQRQLRDNFDAIELECEQLRKETFLITQQSVNTQIRLFLMFQILKARENHDFSKASQLTCALREMIEKENQQRKL